MGSYRPANRQFDYNSVSLSGTRQMSGPSRQNSHGRWSPRNSVIRAVLHQDCTVLHAGVRQALHLLCRGADVSPVTELA